MNDKVRLYPEDQAKVDEFLNTGYNATERKPFRPIKLLFFLWIIVSIIGFFAWSYTKYHGLI